MVDQRHEKHEVYMKTGCGIDLIQRPEDGINPLAEAPTNSEHPCQVYLTNKTRCIAMFSRNS